jgi:hypothetical protein
MEGNLHPRCSGISQLKKNFHLTMRKTSVKKNPHISILDTGKKYHIHEYHSLVIHIKG